MQGVEIQRSGQWCSSSQTAPYGRTNRCPVQSWPDSWCTTGVYPGTSTYQHTTPHSCYRYIRTLVAPNFGRPCNMSKLNSYQWNFYTWKKKTLKIYMWIMMNVSGVNLIFIVVSCKNNIFVSKCSNEKLFSGILYIRPLIIFSCLLLVYQS